MIEEAITKIADLATDAEGVTITTIPGANRRVWMQANRVVTEVKLDPPLRAHKLRCLEDLAALAVDKEVAEKPTLWHCHEKVVLAFDDTDRREFATLDL